MTNEREKLMQRVYQVLKAALKIFRLLQLQRARQKIGDCRLLAIE